MKDWILGRNRMWGVIRRIKARGWPPQGLWDRLLDWYAAGLDDQAERSLAMMAHPRVTRLTLDAPNLNRDELHAQLGRRDAKITIKRN